MASFAIVRTINLPVEKVWSVLGNFTRSPAPDINIRVEKEGDTGLDGVGTIRTVTVGKESARQVIETVDPFHSYTYRMTDHPLLKEYKANCELTGEEESTVVHYHAALKPRIPLTGGLACLKAKAAVNKYFDLIEKHHCGKQ
ncbi:MAG: SRPBCC family protein [Dethiobacteria bacterium]|nr:SRPBCC family protein [Dethiobacteria bacterium]